MTCPLEEVEGRFVVYEEFDTILTPNTGSVRASQVFLCDYGNILSGLVENRLIGELHDRYKTARSYERRTKQFQTRSTALGRNPRRGSIYGDVIIVS